MGGCRRWRPGPGAACGSQPAFVKKGQAWFRGRRRSDVRVAATPRVTPQLKRGRPRAFRFLCLGVRLGFGVRDVLCAPHETRQVRGSTPGPPPVRAGLPAPGQSGCARGAASPPGHCAAPQRWLPLQTRVSAQAPAGGGQPPPPQRRSGVGEGRRVTRPPGRSCGGAAPSPEGRGGGLRPGRAGAEGRAQGRGLRSLRLARRAPPPRPGAAAAPLQSWAGTRGRRGLSEAGGQGRDCGLVAAAVEPPGPARVCCAVARRAGGVEAEKGKAVLRHQGGLHHSCRTFKSVFRP